MQEVLFEQIDKPWINIEKTDGAFLFGLRGERAATLFSLSPSDGERDGVRGI
jgi:hypothetical protein